MQMKDSSFVTQPFGPLVLGRRYQRLFLRAVPVIVGGRKTHFHEEFLVPQMKDARFLCGSGEALESEVPSINHGRNTDSHFSEMIGEKVLDISHDHVRKLCHGVQDIIVDGLGFGFRLIQHEHTNRYQARHGRRAAKGSSAAPVSCQPYERHNAAGGWILVPRSSRIGQRGA